jgi:protein SCO1/2
MGTSQKVLTTALWALMALAMLSLVGTGLWGTRHGHATGAAPLIAVTPEKQEQGLPVLFNLPPFELVDQDNRPIRDTDLKGHAWVGCFVFTHCAGPCPMMFLKLAEMQNELIDKRVKSVCLTVDPDRDTPDVLKAKAKDLKADDASWSFITGEKLKVDKLLREMLQPRPGPGDNPLMHDTKFYLFDSQGRCRGRYSSIDNDALTALKRDAATLGAQAKSHGGKPS